MAKVTIKGIEEIQAKLKQIKPQIVAGVKAGAVHIEGKVKKYPAATYANSPRTYTPGSGWNTWYERGWGQKWPVASGGWHGKKNSEQLGQQWTTELKNGGLTAVIGNKVSYAHWVHSGTMQARALKRIGWKTDEEIAEQEADKISQFIKEYIDKALG
jgi:hypothetical protein